MYCLLSMIKLSTITCLLLNHLALKQKIRLQTYFLSCHRSVRIKDIPVVLIKLLCRDKKGFTNTVNY